MPTLYLMRHAQSEANVRDILAGQREYPLTAVGRADAEAIATAFCRLHTPGVIVSSPLIRAQETAQPFVSRLALPLRLDDRLLEELRIRQ